jgi:hypothetical protein
MVILKRRNPGGMEDSAGIVSDLQGFSRSGFLALDHAFIRRLTFQLMFESRQSYNQ